MKKIHLLILILFCYISVYGQVSEGGLPPSFENPIKLRSTLPKYDAPVNFDVRQLIWEDEMVDKNGGAPRFAVTIPIDINIETAGEWTVLSDSSKIWQQSISAKGAQAIIISYKDFYIPKGGKLYIYNRDRSQILGAYTNNTNPGGGLFATEMISGDELTLEYVSSKTSKENPRIQIEDIGYVYNLKSISERSLGLNTSDKCMININCADGRRWQNQKRGVVRLLIKILGEGGWRYCSGSLVNNTAEDGKPYVLTADHCFAGNAIPEQSMLSFNYEFESCTGSSAEPEKSKTQIGIEVLARTPIKGGADGALLYVTRGIPSDWYPYFNGWDTRNVPAQSGVVIHHPNGDVKKITTYVNPLKTSTYYGQMGQTGDYNAHWEVVYDGRSVTQGGSSGSPIFNESGLIVGALTGGSSYCNYPLHPDYFAKLWYNWDQYTSPAGESEQKMSRYLDPLNKGIRVLNGYDPNPPTGIEEDIKQGEDKEFAIFPNPTQNDLNINTNSIIRNITVFDLRGRSIYKMKNYNASTITVPVSDWSKGVYTIVLETETGKVTSKFIKN